MLNIKTLPVSEKNLIKFGIFFPMFDLVIPGPQGQSSPQGYYLNKLCRRLLGDATYQINNIYAPSFREKEL